MIRTGKSMSIGLCLYLNIGKEECAILSDELYGFLLHVGAYVSQR